MRRCTFFKACLLFFLQNQGFMKKNKIIFILIFNCVLSFLYGQDKKVVILDSLTNEPLNLVQIYYPSLQIGGITNEDGKAIIPIKEGIIKISHINYDTKTIGYKEFKFIDTLKLYPKLFTLNEVVIYSFDLKKKLSEVLKVYRDNYSEKNIMSYSTYKETNEVNDSLVRLFQIQLDWWSKNYIYDFNSKVEKFNKIKIKSIDYSKISPDSPFTAKGTILDNSDFLKFSYLNFLLYVIKYKTDNIVINSINNKNSLIQINFDGEMIEEGKTMYRFKNSSIVFKGNTIYNVILNMNYNNEITHTSVSKEGKVPYTSKIYSHSIELSFKKDHSNKLYIALYTSNILGEMKIYDNLKNIKISQSLMINKTKIGKRLKNTNFDLEKPFYKNLDIKTKSNDVKFLLTKKEIDFINE